MVCYETTHRLTHCVCWVRMLFVFDSDHDPQQVKHGPRPRHTQLGFVDEDKSAGAQSLLDLQDMSTPTMSSIAPNRVPCAKDGGFKYASNIGPNMATLQSCGPNNCRQRNARAVAQHRSSSTCCCDCGVLLRGEPTSQQQVLKTICCALLRSECGTDGFQFAAILACSSAGEPLSQQQALESICCAVLHSERATDGFQYLLLRFWRAPPRENQNRSKKSWNASVARSSNGSAKQMLPAAVFSALACSSAGEPRSPQQVLEPICCALLRKTAAGC